LYKILNAHRPDEVRPPDLACQLIRHIDRTNSVSSIGGYISIGGFVTILAKHFGVLPEEGPIYREGYDPGFIDWAYLSRNARLMCLEGDVYYHIPFKNTTPRVPLPLPPIDRENPYTWQAHYVAAHDVAGTSQPPPPQQQYHDDDGSLMAYLTAMDGRIGRRFDQIDGRLTGIETRVTRVEEQFIDFQTAHTQHDRTMHQRFDDVYTMGRDQHQYLQDIYAVEYQMARFNINEGMAPIELPPHTFRDDWSYPFTFPPPGPRPNWDDQQ
jgi:hypothetical protein